MSNIVLANITVGMAKMTIHDITRIDQTNNGMRCSAIPGARKCTMVTINATAIDREPSSVNVIVCAQKSARFPSEIA